MLRPHTSLLTRLVGSADGVAGSMAVKILAVAAVMLVFIWCRPAFAALEDGVITTRLVKIISVDDSGQPIGFPSQVVFDPVHQETYIYSSSNRITIYDKDYFPLGSIGEGRGVVNVIGMAVSREGKLYLLRTVYNQGGISQQSVLTVFNRALLRENEIFLEKIPEMAGFWAQSVAVADDGTIYVVGNIYSGQNKIVKGAAVLDREGNFLRWQSPRGMVVRWRAAPVEDAKPTARSSLTSEADFAENIPDSLKPSVAAETEAVQGGLALGDGIADLVYVTIDANGLVYLLSTETSEIYVYDSQGSFKHKFGTKGGAKGKLSTPRMLAVDYPRRVIYVCDYMRHTILTYDYDDGSFLYEFGGKGSAPLWFLHPQAIAVDNNGRVIIADLFNQRVQVLDPTNPDRPVLEPIFPEPSPAGPVSAAVAPEPTLTVPLTGLENPVKLAATAFPSPVPLSAAREIEPDQLKKKTVAAVLPELVMPDPPADLPTTGVVGLPGQMAPPAGFEVDPLAEKADQGKVKALGNALKAVVGVYGPVAALLGVGNWLLQRDR